MLQSHLPFAYTIVPLSSQSSYLDCGTCALTSHIGSNDVLIKLNATGICYSDIHYMLNDLPIPKMSVFGVRSPGHEGAGVIVKVGSNVTNWKVGDRAGIKPAYDACFNCELCWTGKGECHDPKKK